MTKLFNHLTVWTSKVTGKNNFSAFFDQEVDRRKRFPNSFVIGNFAVFQRHVEINTNKYTFTRQICYVTYAFLIHRSSPPRICFCTPISIHKKRRSLLQRRNDLLVCGLYGPRTRDRSSTRRAAVHRPSLLTDLCLQCKQQDQLRGSSSPTRCRTRK
ncbi:hypothetical protein D3C78_839290 [compost metagenome]